MASSRLKCTFCPISSCIATSATANATTAKHWKSATKAKPSRSAGHDRRRCGRIFQRRSVHWPENSHTLTEVGLSYITLGQNATTLSGGEAQRVKLAKELSKRDTGKTLYILDEPTTGLHFHDIKQLLSVLHTLRDHGNTVIVIEHNLDVIKTADWIIDMGPEGGDGGGTLVAEGTPKQVSENPASHTGVYLKRFFE